MRVVGDYGYIEPGDEVELYDERGLSLNLVQIVEDESAVNFHPTSPCWVASMRVATPDDGPSAVLGFDPQVRITGDDAVIHIDPVLTLGKARRVEAVTGQHPSS